MSDSNLPRVIGTPGVAFTAFNCVVGVGIFGLPGLVAALLGAAAITAYVVCLVLFGLIALCFAEAGSRVTRAGGLYAYASAAFGPVTGGVAGALMIVASSIGSAAAITRFFLDTLASAWPLIGERTWNHVALVVLYGGIALVNIRGTRDGNGLTILIGILKFVPLTLLIVAGAFFVDMTNLAWPGWPAVGKVGDATVLLFFAFIGLESGLSISGQTRDPSRTIPRALGISIAMIALLYIGLQTVTQGVLGTALATTKVPLIDTARVLFGDGGARFMVALTLVSAFGFMAGDMLGSPRVVHALAREGQLPAVLGRVHPRFATPAVAIAAYAVAVMLVAATGSFRDIAVLTVAGTLVLYLIVCVGVLRLRLRQVAESGAPFVAPGGPVVPIAAAAIIIWLLSTLAWREMVATAVFVAACAVVYAARHARRK
jgi:APA family basic amino acid/polyamine antiporter